MPDIELMPVAWAAYHGAGNDSAKAAAIVGLLSAGSLAHVFDASDTLIRTVTHGAWSKGAVANNRYALTPGTFTANSGGDGSPVRVSFANAAGTTVMSMTAGVSSGVVRFPTAVASATGLSAGSFSVSLPTTDAGGDPTPSPTGKRFNPGHYLYAGDDVNYAYMTNSSTGQDRRSLIAARDGWAGYVVQVWWSKLEPSQGTYSLGGISADLDQAQTDGKQLIVRVMDRRWSSSRPYPLPSYIAATIGGMTSGAATSGGFVCARLWNTAVGERFIQLCEAIYAEFEDHPAFEGILIEESSNPTHISEFGYTHIASANFYDTCSQRMAASQGRANFWFNMNYGYTSSGVTPTRREITDRMVLRDKNQIGASDARPRGARNGGSLDYSFDIFEWGYQGIAALYSGCEWNTYALVDPPKRPDGSWADHTDVHDGTGDYRWFSLTEVFNNAVDQMKLTHMGWMVRNDSSNSSTGTVSFNITDVINYLERSDVNYRIVSTRPKNSPA